MLSSQALHEEITIGEDVCKKSDSTVEDLLKVLVKLASLQLKLTHNIRTNQTVIMDHEGIQLKKTAKDEDQVKK